MSKSWSITVFSVVVAALSSTESLSPPPERAPALQRLRRFLSALLQFAGDAGADAGERVRTLVHNLAVSRRSPSINKVVVTLLISFVMSNVSNA